LPFAYRVLSFRAIPKMPWLVSAGTGQPIPGSLGEEFTTAKPAVTARGVSALAASAANQARQMHSPCALILRG
jgi:hypothetical protein